MMDFFFYIMPPIYTWLIFLNFFVSIILALLGVEVRVYVALSTMFLIILGGLERLIGDIVKDLRHRRNRK